MKNNKLYAVLCGFCLIGLFTLIGCDLFETDVEPSSGNTGGSGDCDYTQWTGSGSCSQTDYYPVYTNSCCPSGYPYYNTATEKCYISCEGARDASSSGSVYRYNTTGGNGGGSGSSGYNCVNDKCEFVSSGAQYSSLSACEAVCGKGGGGGGSGCTNMTSYTSATTEWISNCGNGKSDLLVRVTNNSNQTLYVRIEIQKSDGTWSCGGGVISSGDYLPYWVCGGTGKYKYGAILSSEFGNGCIGPCGE